MPDRIPSLLEQSIKSNAAGPTITTQILSNLGAASASDITTYLLPLSGQNISQASQIQELSGNSISQAAQIASISGGVSTSYVDNISAQLTIDMENLDGQIGTLQAYSLQVVAMSAAAATGSPTFWCTVSISGQNYRLGLFPE